MNPSRTPVDNSSLPSPRYMLEEKRLRANLSLIRRLAEQAGVEFILAFKAFALWRTFPIFREYIRHTTASSLYEARLAAEEFGTKAHTYSPAYEDETFDQVAACSSHLTFNSLTQYERFRLRAAGVSLGLRVNPEYSEIETELYNPCAPGSRFGVLAEQLPARLPDDIRGLHFHCHCESDSYALERTLSRFEERFAPWLGQVEWVNFGGGHLVTREGYDTEHLVGLLRAFRARYPHLRVVLEPGSAFAWQTGTLSSRVVDIVENRGVRTAILNVSFTCHMPDCLEMPYTPRVLGAEICAPDAPGAVRLGGNSCLSGDFMGWWRFERPLSVGDEVVFDDMIHYTTVKTHMFNGIHHPALCLARTDGRVEVLRRFDYEDYRDRMD
ncbi:MAG: carboxynorspermidine decarboxylase [Prevotellaceae bacterium]|nr:carboxynorspermidine decarboxylase [Prevotellaceae bacterium]